jgi:SAM-dependent methyltransferase
VLSTPSRSSATELLDSPASIAPEIAANLADIRRTNSWFGGTSLAIRCLRQVTDGHVAVSLLDVGTGSADIPLAQLKWATQSGLRLRVTASDVSQEVLSEAARVVGDNGVDLCLADARELPWPAGSFDVVQSCLALHHFEPAEAVRVLFEMRRVARLGIVITDLRRSRPGYIGTRLATLVAARSRVTRHDGPLSVLRAYTTTELSGLAVEALIPNAQIRRHAFFRQSLIALKPA